MEQDNVPESLYIIDASIWVLIVSILYRYTLLYAHVMDMCNYYYIVIIPSRTLCLVIEQVNMFTLRYSMQG